MNMQRSSLWNKLPDFSKWKGTDSSRTLSDYLYAKGSVDFAIAFAALFWPTVERINGCYIRSDVIAKGGFSVETGLSLQQCQAIEKSMNKLYIYELFEQDNPNIDLEVEEFIAIQINEMWYFALKKQFPEEEFAFEYLTEPQSYGPTVTFWHE